MISRAAWGADESLRFAGDDEIWPPQLRPVRLVVIHHTNTKNDDPDPCASLRAIYGYHCVAKGWGDIGYHYVVDEHGAVYEGRFSEPDPAERDDIDGRLGVVGGHALGFNYGSLGIGLLGSLHTRLPTTEATSALAQLIAVLAARYELDPTGTVSRTELGQDGEDLPVVIGHRHVTPAQDCPGRQFEDTLPELRRNVVELMDARSVHRDARRAPSR